jgi:hypothetical protein
MFGLHNDKVITVAIPEFFKALRNWPTKTAKTVRIKSRIKSRRKPRIKSRIKPRRKPTGKSKKHHVPTKFYSYRLGKGYDEAWRANMSAANEELPTLSERLRAMEINNAEKDNECPICLVQMTDDEASTTLNCGHKFHNRCLENMVRYGHNRCPLCRTATTDPLIQRQQIIEELQALAYLEERIASLRDRLNNPNRNMRLNNAMQIQQIAARYEEEAQRHYNEANSQFTTYIRLHGIDVNIPMYIELSNMRTITLDLLTRARENTRSARQLLNNVRHITSLTSYNIT